MLEIGQKQNGWLKGEEIRKLLGPAKLPPPLLPSSTQVLGLVVARRLSTRTLRRVSANFLSGFQSFLSPFLPFKLRFCSFNIIINKLKNNLLLLAWPSWVVSVHCNTGRIFRRLPTPFLSVAIFLTYPSACS